MPLTEIRTVPVSDLREKEIPYYGVKEAVFPFNMFPEVDPVLGPEMRSTGEVLGLSPYCEVISEVMMSVASGTMRILHTLETSGTVRDARGFASST